MPAEAAFLVEPLASERAASAPPEGQMLALAAILAASPTATGSEAEGWPAAPLKLNATATGELAGAAGGDAPVVLRLSARRCKPAAGPCSDDNALLIPNARVELSRKQSLLAETSQFSNKQQ